MAHAGPGGGLGGAPVGEGEVPHVLALDDGRHARHDEQPALHLKAGTRNRGGRGIGWKENQAESAGWPSAGGQAGRGALVGAAREGASGSEAAAGCGARRPGGPAGAAPPALNSEEQTRGRLPRWSSLVGVPQPLLLLWQRLKLRAGSHAGSWPLLVVTRDGVRRGWHHGGARMGCHGLPRVPRHPAMTPQRAWHRLRVMAVATACRSGSRPSPSRGRGRLACSSCRDSSM